MVKPKPFAIFSYCTTHKKVRKMLSINYFMSETNNTKLKGAKSASLRPRIRERAMAA
jgi:hypothetical protein